MAAIDYSAGARIVTENSHVVYTREAWDDSWTEQPNLKCTECQWASAPQMSSAVLRWDVGSVILPGTTTPTTITPWVGRGFFVRVDWLCDDGVSVLRWVGFIDSSEWPTEAFGSQTIVCFGLDQALAKTPMFSVFRWDETTEGVIESSLPLRFNGFRALRSAVPTEVDGDVYVFQDAQDAAPVKWSTREIVRYLIELHFPASAAFVWTAIGLDLLPAWDAPEVDTRNKMVWDVLIELVNAEYQLGFAVASDGDDVFIKFFTHVATDLEIGSITVPANPTTHTIVFAPDALTDARFADVGGGYDQVICRGARRMTICSLRWYELDFDWTAGLSTDQQEVYDAGASGDSGYDEASPEEKRALDAAARSAADLRNVYRRFRLDPDWDFTLATVDVFPDNETPHIVEFVDRLPIAPGMSWDGSTAARAAYDRTGPGQGPILVWDIGVDQWCLNNKLDSVNWVSTTFATGFPEFAVDLSVQRDRFDLSVEGAPQYMIAKGLASLNASDWVPDMLSFHFFVLTIALAEDRLVEGVYPAWESTPAVDVVRRLVVDLGDAYQQIWVAAGTVTEVGSGGALVATSGGFYLVDDSVELQAIAEVIGRSVLLTRKSVSWSSARKIATIAVGDLITTAGGATINAPVVNMRMEAPVGIDRPARATRQQYETYRGTMDVLALVARRMG